MNVSVGGSIVYLIEYGKSFFFLLFLFGVREKVRELEKDGELVVSSCNQFVVAYVIVYVHNSVNGSLIYEVVFIYMV